MYADYKQVGMKLHSDCLLKLYGVTTYVALMEFQKENENL